jgi:glycosyltransferase involved in cell wall biosynthesis
LRILLVGNYPPDKQESMLRFAALLERELTARGHEVTLSQPAPLVGQIKWTNSSIRKWLGYVDKFLFYPSRLSLIKTNFDIVHICDHSNAMYVRYLVNVPHVVTCHDVLAIRSALGEIPQNPVSSTGRKFQALILAGLEVAERIVCVSENTRIELLRVTGRNPSSATVTYLSLNYPYSPAERDAALVRLDKLGFDARTPYLMHVGGTVWYKNKLGVLQIFNHLQKLIAPSPMKLLMIGKALSPPLLEYISENNLENLIEKRTNLSNEDLRAAYTLSEGLIFPSLQEGFGWPVLEAQACGCPVFTTARAPMTEVGGDAAVYFDPSDTTGSAEIVAQALKDREAIRQRGIANSLRFNVEQMIQGYIDAYEQVINQHRNQRSS